MMVVDMTNIQQLRQLVDDSQRIAIFGHRNIDGDAIGSSLGL